VHAINRRTPRLDDTIAVLGDGTIGLCVLVAAADARRRILMGHHERPLKLAEQWGAIPVNSTETDAAEAIDEITEGQGADIVYETVGGSSPSLEEAARLVRPGGTIVYLGCFSRSPVVPIPSLLRNEVDLIPSWSYAYFRGVPEFQIALDTLASGRVELASLITHHYPLQQIGEAFETALDKGKSQAIKVLVHPGE